MVDEVRLARLLRAVSDDRCVLDAESTADDRRRRDPLWLRGVKYSFVTMIEACVDIAQHAALGVGQVTAGLLARARGAAPTAAS